MHLILPKISTESDFLWWKEHKGSPKRVGKKIWFGTFNCIYNSWINIYLSRCKCLFNDIFVKFQGLETVKIWLLRSRDNSKQDGKSLCCKLVIHLFENTTPYCHVDLNLHLDLDPCVPLSLPINKLEMSLCVRKEFPFCVTSSSKAHKEFKMHTQRGLFLMEIDTKGQLLTKLEKSKHFKAEFVMTEFMGSKVEFCMLHCILTKVSKALDTLQLFFWRKKVSFLNRESHMHFAVLLPTLYLV